MKATPTRTPVTPPDSPRTRRLVEAGLASAAKTVTATYKYHYNGFMPIGPQPRLPTSSMTAAVGRSTIQAQDDQRHPGPDPVALGQAPNSKGNSGRGASSRYEGVELVRRRSEHRGGARAGRGRLAASRQAGAPAVDALGRARLGPLRPSRNMSDVTMGADANGQDRRLRLAVLRPGAEQQSTSPARAARSGGRGADSASAGGIAPMDAAAVDCSVLDRLTTAIQTFQRRSAREHPSRSYGGAFKCNSPAAAPSCTAAVLRKRADRRRARARREHGSVRVPPREHRSVRLSPARSLAGGHGCIDGRSGLEAEGRRLEPADRRRRYRPRLRPSAVFAGTPGRHRRRCSGDQEDRQGRRQAPVRLHRTTGSRWARSSSGTR